MPADQGGVKMDSYRSLRASFDGVSISPRTAHLRHHRHHPFAPVSSITKRSNPNPSYSLRYSTSAFIASHSFRYQHHHQQQQHSITTTTTTAASYSPPSPCSSLTPSSSPPPTSPSSDQSPISTSDGESNIASINLRSSISSFGIMVSASSACNSMTTDTSDAAFLAREWHTLERIAPPITTFESERNRQKNRYIEHFTIDHTRVKLCRDIDYINANYISDGRCNPKAYIAAQAPTPSTMCDFWQMLWEQDIRLVVMLTKLLERNIIKAHRYWPAAVGDSSDYGGIVVRTLSEVQNGDIIIREFVVSDTRSTAVASDATRHLVHIQYTGWPDRGAPDSIDGFVRLLETIHAFESNTIASNAPMLVHCSAGIGRTGTFCAAHSLLKPLREFVHSGEYSPPRVQLDPLSFNVFNRVFEMRHQRQGMVQSFQQYVFCWQVVSKLATSMLRGRRCLSASYAC